MAALDLLSKDMLLLQAWLSSGAGLWGLTTRPLQLEYASSKEAKEGAERFAQKKKAKPHCKEHLTLQEALNLPLHQLISSSCSCPAFDGESSIRLCLAHYPELMAGLPHPQKNALQRL